MGYVRQLMCANLLGISDNFDVSRASTRGYFYGKEATVAKRNDGTRKEVGLSDALPTPKLTPEALGSSVPGPRGGGEGASEGPSLFLYQETDSDSCTWRPKPFPPLPLGLEGATLRVQGPWTYSWLKY